MPSAWEQEQPEETWSDREAWRGGLHGADEDAWRGESPEPWQSETPDPALEPELEAQSDWRGEVHFADWPEDMAGPEYWLFKRDSE